MRIVYSLAVLVLSASLMAADAAAVKEKVLKGIAESTVSDKVKALAKDKLVPLMSNPVLVAEAKAQNAKKVPVAELKKIEKDWAAAEEELPIQKEKLNNACAAELKKTAKEIPALAEAFAMDDQGAIVGESNLTSGFWKGEHNKWRVPFGGGFYADALKFDKSTNISIQQIALPIVDEQGNIVGAVVYGLDVAKL